jgi:NAD(P)-dependent dehydrogenase (short-subunit alcohol dehydrogenase family)
LDFTDKVAIISGARMGIGRALAEALLRRGACVVVNARDARALAVETQNLASLDGGPMQTQNLASLRDRGRVHAVAGDVGRPEDCRRIVEETLRVFGKIDILINNAGISGKGSVAESDPVVFQTQVNTNLLGPIYLTRYALSSLQASKGSVLFVSTLAAIRGLPFHSGYSASKMGLTAFAESLKVELHGEGVHVGIAYVGFTENDPDKSVINAAGHLERLPRRAGVRQTPASKTADLILRQIASRKFKVVHSSIGKWNWVLSKIAPWVVEWVFVRNMGRF